MVGVDATVVFCGCGGGDGGRISIIYTKTGHTYIVYRFCNSGPVISTIRKFFAELDVLDARRN